MLLAGPAGFLALAAAPLQDEVPAALSDVDPTLLLVLNLAGTFVFGLSGGLAGARRQLDVFGIVVLAVVVGIVGGITRDLLIGIPPQTFRDWRFLVTGAAAGLLCFMAHHLLTRLERPILVFDAGGLALFCVTGAATALSHDVGPLEAAVLGAITGVGGGAMRDVLLGEVPAVLRTGLYAIPALVGATVVVVAWELDWRGVGVALGGAATCFAIRLAGIYWDLHLPRAEAHQPEP